MPNQLYVQQMEELPAEICILFAESGYFTIPCSDKYWAGVRSDLTIEQVLMRAIKTSGGLTGRRGLYDSTVARWIKSLPLTIPLCNNLDNFAGVSHEPSEQHKELRTSRQIRDNHDADCFIEWLEARPTFQSRPTTMLVSLSTGLVPDGSVNCDDALRVGLSSQKDMVGQNFTKVKLYRKNRVKSLASVNNLIKIRGKAMVVHHQQMLSRILSFLDSATDLAAYMKYELASRPPSLFDDISLRKPAKAALASSLVPPGTTVIPQNLVYVIGGGHIIHSVVWPSPATYAEISLM